MSNRSRKGQRAYQAHVTMLSMQPHMCLNDTCSKLRDSWQPEKHMLMPHMPASADLLNLGLKLAQVSSHDTMSHDSAQSLT